MDCKIARDLMQLYSDAVLSEKSEKFLKEHLEGCDPCRKYMEQLKDKRLKDEDLGKSRDNKLIKALKRRKYELSGLAFGAIMMAVIFPLLIFFGIKYLNSTVDITISSPDSFVLEDYKGNSKLKLFPDQSYVQGNIRDYYYRGTGRVFNYAYCISLDCIYSEEDYAREVERLENVKDKKQARYIENETDLPMICAMFNDGGYEYALLDNASKEIRYIYLQNADRGMIPFDNSLVPEDYGWDGASDKKGNLSFSIY